MEGVVVDFRTLYDPVALTGAVLTYVPFYNRIYASRHSFRLEATPITQGGWVPVDGFKQLDQGLDDPGIKWLRGWCKNSLQIPEDSIVHDNLYASIVLIQRLIDADLLKPVPFEDTFIQFAGQLLDKEDMLGALTSDSMMPFGEGKKDGFYLSPDLGHGVKLGTAVIMKAKDELRFSTSSSLIMRTLTEQVLPKLYSPLQYRTQRDELNTAISCGPTLCVDDVFRLLDAGIGESEPFLSRIEQSGRDLLFFMMDTSLGNLRKLVVLKRKVTAETWKRLRLDVQELGDSSRESADDWHP